MNEPQNSSAEPVGSCALLDINQPGGNDNGQLLPVPPKNGGMAGREHLCKTSSLPTYDDVKIPLLVILDGIECPTAGKEFLNDLARTDLHRQHLQALAHLWRSLGRPVEGFWRELYVFCNRIRDSYAQMSNDQAEPRLEVDNG